MSDDRRGQVGKVPPPTVEVIEEAHRHYNRQLTPEEYAAVLASETSPEEMEEKRGLVAWFTRRYPTPAERLAYNRRYVATATRTWPRRPL